MKGEESDSCMRKNCKCACREAEPDDNLHHRRSIGIGDDNLLHDFHSTPTAQIREPGRGILQVTWSVANWAI